MNMYEFIGSNPGLTTFILVVLIVAIADTIKNCVGNKEKDDE